MAAKAVKGRQKATGRGAASSALSASARVLAWLEQHIREKGLVPGDGLPTEMEIMAAAGTGRSSVREALTALKVLGIIRQRRKGGISLIRDPILLELRHYFAEHFEDKERFDDTMEYRAALEWGFGPLVFSHTTAGMVKSLRALLNEVETGSSTAPSIHAAEVRFHSLLASGGGNQLADIFSHLYAPLFHWNEADVQAMSYSPAFVAEWVAQHAELVDALDARDEAAFLRALKEHTHSYMRLAGNAGKT